MLCLGVLDFEISAGESAVIVYYSLPCTYIRTVLIVASSNIGLWHRISMSGIQIVGYLSKNLCEKLKQK